MQSPEGFRQDDDGFGICADVPHVGYEAEQHHDRHTDSGEAIGEDRFDYLQLVVERIASGFNFACCVIDLAHRCSDHHEHDADGEN